MAIAFTPLLCPLSVCSSSPVNKFHTRTVSSRLPLASTCPPGLICTDVTHEVCPVSVIAQRQDADCTATLEAIDLPLGGVESGCLEVGGLDVDAATGDSDRPCSELDGLAGGDDATDRPVLGVGMGGRETGAESGGLDGRADGTNESAFKSRITSSAD